MARTTWTRGTTEYLTGTVTADVTLDTQPVAVTFDKTTFVTAAWTGTAGTTRGWQVLLTDTNLPVNNQSFVYVRVTDNPEIPLFRAGILTFN